MLYVQRHRKDEVRVVGAAEQETHVDRRGQHGQRRGEQRGPTEKGQTCSPCLRKSVLGSQELGPATCRPQGGLALDADWAVGMQPLLIGSTRTPCSQEARNVSQSSLGLCSGLTTEHGVSLG